MRAKIKNDKLILIGRSIKEYEHIIRWCSDHYGMEWIVPICDSVKKEKPAKVIEIRVTGIPSEIHILKGDLH